jgi:hypothetical protein
MLVRLLDGKPHRVIDMVAYLSDHVDPAKATRVYLMERSRYKTDVTPMPPLEKQIAVGRRRMIMSSIAMTKQVGLIDVQAPAGYGQVYQKGVLHITEKGRDMLKTYSLNEPGGGMWKEIKKLYKNGKIDLHITFRPSVNGAEAHSLERTE